MSRIYVYITHTHIDAPVRSSKWIEEMLPEEMVEYDDGVLLIAMHRECSDFSHPASSRATQPWKHT